MKTFTMPNAGRFSKAWWLKHVLKHGQDGGMHHLSKAGRTSYERTKAAIDNLYQTGYVKMRAEGHPRYLLTPKGEEYLNEHMDEAGDDELDPEQPAAPRPPQPAVAIGTPEKPAGTIPQPAAAEPPTPDKDIVRHEAKTIPTPPNTPKTAEKTPFRDAFKAVLIDILLERYADKVTAAEVMDRLDGRR